ncbi:hypothetical protein ASA1KI_31490 [Opitutales bacterium ASA1]|uniref:hypothetical protein n=1 Tax=Congregicoccus parvus TaxID=3081749 RepID=UPI002B2B5E48|nr:hypothetical protein ASA1KI_31490 [Opitutales bacterium ASA1]
MKRAVNAIGSFSSFERVRHAFEGMGEVVAEKERGAHAPAQERTYYATFINARKRFLPSPAGSIGEHPNGIDIGPA